MSTTTNVIFPSELADAIIDQIYWEDIADQRLRYRDPGIRWQQWEALRLFYRRSLCACSIVCKSWLPRSRYRLFKTVELERLTSMRKKPQNFVALLEDPLSTIPPYVRHLTLEEALDRNEYEVRWLNGVLSQLTVLSAIESLVVDGARFEMLETEDITKFFASFQSLKLLRLRRCVFWSYTQMIEILSANPNLEDLTLDARPTIQAKQDSNLDAAERIGHSEPLRCLPPPHLKTLTIGSVDNKEEIVKWLTSGSTIPSVQSLRLSIVKANDSRFIADFLRALGPSLKDLRIGFYNNSSASTNSQGACFFYYYYFDFDLDTSLFILSRCLLSIAIYQMLFAATPT
jgi:hypothetical protein